MSDELLETDEGLESEASDGDESVEPEEVSEFVIVSVEPSFADEVELPVLAPELLVSESTASELDDPEELSSVAVGSESFDAVSVVPVSEAAALELSGLEEVPSPEASEGEELPDEAVADSELDEPLDESPEPEDW